MTKILYKSLPADKAPHKILELLADNEHATWSSWMLWLFRCGTINDDGSFTIPQDKVERWKRQATTNYAGLSEEEKESDRMQVYRATQAVLNIIEEDVIGEDEIHNNRQRIVNPLECVECGTPDERYTRNNLRAEQRSKLKGE